MPAAIVTPAVAVFEKETGVKTPVKKLTFSQYKKMIDNAAREFHLEEVQWKRVDKLEEFVDACNDYSIENKTWQRMEKYVAVYLAAGGEADEALDSVLANHIIGEMLHSVVNVKLNEKFSNTLENIFGEGQVPHSIRVVKSTNTKI
jgi:chromosome condensin MukBEF ATPase and DNA-binding subunit MukB